MHFAVLFFESLFLFLHPNYRLLFTTKSKRSINSVLAEPEYFESAFFAISAYSRACVLTSTSIPSERITSTAFLRSFLVAFGLPNVLRITFLSFPRSEEHTSELQSQSNLVFL